MHTTTNLTILALLSALTVMACAADSAPLTGGTAEETEEPGEIEGDEPVDGPLAGSSSEELPPAISESEEQTAPPAVSGGPKTISTKVLPNGIVAVYEDGGWIASFTKGTRTVRIAGSPRTFRDPTEGASGGVSHDQYVRLLSKPFGSFGDPERTWLTARRADTSPDVLAIGMEYLDGTALDPKYVFGNDYDDYLAEKNPARRGIDCSGFIRLVYGHRTLPALLTGGLLPRVSKNQLANGTGVLTVANDGKQPTTTELQRLRIGDLVFFDVSARNDDTGGIDHVGFYVGKDSAGHMRFLNSTPNNGKMTGPTMMTKFVLDGTSFWATHFRGARRL